MTRYGWENMVPEFIYRYLYPLQTIHGYEQVYFIIYEQNVCSTHLPFLEYLKKKYPLTYPKEGLSGPYLMEEIYRATK